MSRAPHLLAIEARFYPHISDWLWTGAERAMKAAGATWERLVVPGAFEIPGVIAMAAAGGGGPGARPFDGYVALGCVVRGETSHYDYVCGESARGLMDLAVREKLAIGYGILTVENGAQAEERARPDRRDKGGDAVAACLAMVALRRRFAPGGAS
ncbi:MAG: 6,7-dimethyl-8-ribityllumazine synthase [Alphaproteobacteria bacterium]